MSNKIDTTKLECEKKYVADFGYGVEVLKGCEVEEYRVFGKFDLYEYTGFYSSCGAYIGTVY